jgi:hypothetical protein
MTKHKVKHIVMLATDREGIQTYDRFLLNGQNIKGSQEPNLWTLYWEYENDDYAIEFGYYYYNRWYSLGIQEVKQLVRENQNDNR